MKYLSQQQTRPVFKMLLSFSTKLFCSCWVAAFNFEADSVRDSSRSKLLYRLIRMVTLRI